MLLRNSLILAILALQAFAYSLVPMLIMFAATAILLRFGGGAVIGKTSQPPPDLKLEQPFSLKAALKFGVIFLVLSVAGILAQRSLGVFGFYAVSIAGGLLSAHRRSQRLGPRPHTIKYRCRSQQMERC
jgi:uncharacterized membrane protein (DUF4010 family)